MKSIHEANLDTTMIHILCALFNYIKQSSIRANNKNKDLLVLELLYRIYTVCTVYTLHDNSTTHHIYSMTSIQEEDMQTFSIEELQSAVRNGQFIVYYQPQIDIKTQQIVGVEALVRWNHPTKGVIPPGEFIPLAESSDLIVPIGEFVMNTACNQLKKWHDLGYDIHMGVNVSVKQLQQSNFTDVVIGILKSTAVNPEYIELEITESQSIDTIKEDRIIEKLRQTGIKIAIDDFGTGYSSLGYLKNLSIDTVKLDQIFIRSGMLTNKDILLLSGIFYIIDGLNLYTVIEGVETKEHLSMLKQIFALVDHLNHYNTTDIKDNTQRIALVKPKRLQGYLYGRPMSEDLMEEYLKKSGAAFKDL